jgi:hypothetical protein
MKNYESFQEFYPFYLSQHRNGVCRTLHFIGTSGVIAFFVAAIVLGRPTLFLACPLIGYGFAWVGHFIFEKNKPATFQAFGWSLRGDFHMFADMLVGKLPFRGELPEVMGG